MSTEASEYVVDKANAELLASWLDAGLWTREEAVLVFLNIDPDSVTMECFRTFNRQDEVQYEYADPDVPDSKIPCGYDEDGELAYLTSKQDALFDEAQRLCKKIERSLNRYEVAEPHEWIELARKKGIAIPWLDWAIGTGRYAPTQEPEKRPSPGLVKVSLPNPPQIDMDMHAGAVVAQPANEPRPAATGPVFTMKKAAMIEQHKHEWPTIEQDIKDAKRNGLSMAKAGERDWKEHEAMEWARNKGKLMSN